MTGRRKTVHRIGELAALTGTTPDTLRFYERERLIDPPARTEGGFRVYQAGAIERLGFIRRAQDLGLTIREIASLVSAGSTGKDRCRRVRALLAAKLDATNEQIGRLQSCRRALEKALRDCDASPEATEGDTCAAVDHERTAGKGRPSRPRRSLTPAHRLAARGGSR